VFGEVLGKPQLLEVDVDIALHALEGSIQQDDVSLAGGLVVGADGEGDVATARADVEALGVDDGEDVVEMVDRDGAGIEMDDHRLVAFFFGVRFWIPARFAAGMTEAAGSSVASQPGG